jgi:hypothetical protein
MCHSQVVKVGNNTSSSLILNTGGPPGCVLIPLLYFLFTNDTVATHASFNVNKTKEMIVDFRKQQREHAPIHIGLQWRRWKA